MTRREFAALGVGALGAGCGQASKPNVLIVQVDDLRATAARLYNPDAVPLPNLERLAAAGTTFDHAYSPHPLCCPSRVAFWSGQYSSRNGAQHNQSALGQRTPNMAANLRQAGYTLGIFGKDHCFTKEQRSQWFEHDYSIGSERWNAALGAETKKRIAEYGRWLKEQGGPLLPPAASPFSHEIYGTHLATERALEFLGTRSQKPFCLWVSLPDPHTPIEVPEKFANALPAGSMKMPPQPRNGAEGKNTRTRIYEYLIRGREIPEEYLARYLRIYSGKAAFADYELGRLLDALSAQGLRENTIVLFTSDNGDYAGEHHLLAKTGSMVDAMVRMPLVVSWPGVLPQGIRRDALVNLVDVAPTLLSLCHAPPLDSADGRALPFATGEAGRPYVYSEYGAGDPEYTWAEARDVGPASRLGDYALTTPKELAHLERRERAGRLRMIRTRTHKLVTDSNGETEFYDLTRDPGELENAHGRPEHRETEAELQGLLAGAA